MKADGRKSVATSCAQLPVESVSSCGTKADEYTARRRSPHRAGAQWACNSHQCRRPRASCACTTSSFCPSASTCIPDSSTSSPQARAHCHCPPSQTNAPEGWRRATVPAAATAAPMAVAALHQTIQDKARPPWLASYSHSATIQAPTSTHPQHTSRSRPDACKGYRTDGAIRALKTQPPKTKPASSIHRRRASEADTEGSVHPLLAWLRYA